MEIKNIRRNEVPTTTEMNIACAKLCPEMMTAFGLFRALESANDRGTTQTQADELEAHFNRKEYPFE